LLWGILPVGSSVLAILFALLLPETARMRGQIVALPSYANEQLYADEVHS